jgi:acetyltransferase-like isoleucine patch superfamily enzyme
LGKLSIGDLSTVGSNVVLYQGVAIGKNVVICDFSSIREECIIGRDTVLGRGALLNYGIKIGRGVRIMDSCHFGGNMIIGDSVFIGPHVSSANDNYFELKAQERKRGALIKKDAKIGVGCILLANITIGEGAIIGAGSLVTRSVAAHVLAYGSPARTIKLLSRDAAFA